MGTQKWKKMKNPAVGPFPCKSAQITVTVADCATKTHANANSKEHDFFSIVHGAAGIFFLNQTMKSQTNGKFVSKQCVAQIPFGEDIAKKSVRKSWPSTPRTPPPATLVHGEVPMIPAPRKWNNFGFDPINWWNWSGWIYFWFWFVATFFHGRCQNYMTWTKRDTLAVQRSVFKLSVFVVVSHLSWRSRTICHRMPSLWQPRKPQPSAGIHRRPLSNRCFLHQFLVNSGFIIWRGVKHFETEIALGYTWQEQPFRSSLFPIRSWGQNCQNISKPFLLNAFCMISPPNSNRPLDSRD